jgi:ketosteroid isomerase-like protein
VSQENVELVRRAEEAITRRDLDALRALLAPECEIVPLRTAVDNSVYRGPDAAAKWFAALNEWETISFEHETFREGADWVLTLGRIQVRGRTSGANLDVEAAGVFYFRDGLITKIRNYTDRRDALADVGLEE